MIINIKVRQLCLSDRRHKTFSVLSKHVKESISIGQWPECFIKIRLNKYPLRNVRSFNALIDLTVGYLSGIHLCYDKKARFKYRRLSSFCHAWQILRGIGEESALHSSTRDGT